VLHRKRRRGVDHRPAIRVDPFRPKRVRMRGLRRLARRRRSWRSVATRRRPWIRRRRIPAGRTLRRRKRTSRRRKTAGRRSRAFAHRRHADHRTLEPTRRRPARARTTGKRRGGCWHRATRTTTPARRRLRRVGRGATRRPRTRGRLLLIHHQHRPFELWGRRPFDVEPAFRARLHVVRILGSTVRAEHSDTSVRGGLRASWSVWGDEGAARSPKNAAAKHSARDPQFSSA